jgi:hypothetical protein
MSLDVSPQLLARAERDEFDEAEFVDTVRRSLPYAYGNTTPPPGEAERGQLLRALASDAIRSSLERHFGVTLAFMNCHRVAVFRPGADQEQAYRRFTSTRSQLLNQSPEFRDC